MRAAEGERAGAIGVTPQSRPGPPNGFQPVDEPTDTVWRVSDDANQWLA